MVFHCTVLKEKTAQVCMDIWKKIASSVAAVTTNNNNHNKSSSSNSISSGADMNKHGKYYRHGTIMIRMLRHGSSITSTSSVLIK